MFMNEVSNRLNDPQIVEGIETTVRGSFEGTDEPPFFIEAKCGNGDSHFLGRKANGVPRL
jgi:hypothetical protein